VREAVAAGEVVMRPATLALIRAGGLSKGDVLAVARVAGIMAAKRTPELIPLCHPLPITSVSIAFTFLEERSAVTIEARVKCTGVTGVEMEALTAVSVAALTIYDMCKAVDRGMCIQSVRLLRKSGGRSGKWEASA
jgi:cyclic pyranopterin phosphate synthase